MGSNYELGQGSSSEALLPGTDLTTINEDLSRLDAQERVRWTVETFGAERVAVLTSAGVDAAATIDVVDHVTEVTGQRLQVIHINTGNPHPETIDFRNYLQQLYGFELVEIGPSATELRYIEETSLWESDEPYFRELAKIAPLRRFIDWYGVRAVISGVRYDQSDARAGLDFANFDSDLGVLRIYPIYDWPAEQVGSYIDIGGLPRNDLYYQGRTWVDDQQFTQKKECGLHWVEGRVVRDKPPA